MASQEADTTLLEPRPLPNFVETGSIRDTTHRALTYLAVGFPVHLRGPAGTGKTTLAMHIAAQLGRPVVLVHGDDELAGSDLIGAEHGYYARKMVDNYIHTVHKSEEEVSPRWVDNRLTIAAREGFTLVYDEFSRSRPETNNVLLAVLQERLLDLQATGADTNYVRVHPGFNAIFTSNPGDHAGVHPSQDALLDRMITMDLGYFDDETEIAITQARSQVGEGNARPNRRARQRASRRQGRRRRADRPELHQARPRGTSPRCLGHGRRPGVPADLPGRPGLGLDPGRRGTQGSSARGRGSAGERVLSGRAGCGARHRPDRPGSGAPASPVGAQGRRTKGSCMSSIQRPRAVADLRTLHVSRIRTTLNLNRQQNFLDAHFLSLKASRLESMLAEIDTRRARVDGQLKETRAALEKLLEDRREANAAEFRLVEPDDANRLLARRGIGTRPTRSRARSTASASAGCPDGRPTKVQEGRHVTQDFLYGIVEQTRPSTVGVHGLDGTRPVRVVPSGDLGAVVSADRIASDLRALPRETLLKYLVAYQRVVEHVMRRHSVLPVRFGTQVESAAEVRALVAQNHTILAEAFGRMRGLTELEVAATWDLGRVLAKVGQDPAIVSGPRGDRARRRSLAEARIEFGRLVGSHVERQKVAIRGTALEALTPMASSTVSHALLSSDLVMNEAFLVSADVVPEFERRVHRLDDLFEGQVNFRIIGPLPPYTFCTVEVIRVTAEQRHEATRALGLPDGDADEIVIRGAYRRAAAAAAATAAGPLAPGRDGPERPPGCVAAAARSLPHRRASRIPGRGPVDREDPDHGPGRHPGRELRRGGRRAVTIGAYVYCIVRDPTDRLIEGVRAIGER